MRRRLAVFEPVQAEIKILKHHVLVGKLNALTGFTVQFPSDIDW